MVRFEDSEGYTLIQRFQAAVETDMILAEEDYQLYVTMLANRAKQLNKYAPLYPDTEVDWLALALYYSEQEWFLDICSSALSERDPVFLRAQEWMRKLLDEGYTAFRRYSAK